MNRRSFLAGAAALGSAVLLPRITLVSAEDGFLHLEAGKTSHKLGGADSTLSNLWLYNNKLPGPEIRVKKGRRVRVRFTNNLDEPTSIHWHGIRIENSMDGVAGLTQEPVRPGESFDYDFTAPDAGSYWYHAHNMSWNQVPRGLAGPLIVEDEQPAFAPQRDVTLMLADWLLDDRGTLHQASFGAPMHFSHAGRLGNWLTVNGESLPDIPLATGEWHRLRLINASPARVLDLAPHRFGAKIIGYDGQTFSEPREPESRLQLAPAQRADLAIRPEAPGRIPLELMTGEPFTFANFDAAGSGEGAALLGLPLPNELPKPELASARTIELNMSGGAMGRLEKLVYNGEELTGDRFMAVKQFWGFNGIAGMTDEPMFRAKRGETLVVHSVNNTAFAHAMHLHGHHFRIIERNGAAPPHEDWRDTFHSAPDERVKIAFVADNSGKWLIHCHMLGHAASGMTNWFEVA